MHFMKFENEIYKANIKAINESIETMMMDGQAFELIDGENLDFKGQLIQSVLTKMSDEKIFVVAVIGPQSHGKSTLMNYAFGTQFLTADGRCTSGIYFTL